jgi:PAS domain S-box-containing protein
MRRRNPENQDSAKPMFGSSGISREAMYRAMVEQSLDGMLVLEDSNFVDCNLSAERLYGGTREQIIGITPAELSALTQPDGSNSFESGRHLIGLANGGEPQRFEWLSKRLDGSVFPSEVCLSCLLDRGITRTIVVVRDLTETKRAEEEARRKNVCWRQLNIDPSGSIFGWRQQM